MHSRHALLITVLLVMATILPRAAAHSGRLNTEGCHNQKATGDHHCHRSNAAASAIETAIAFPNEYDRGDYSYRNYKSPSNFGYYTGQPCITNIDHVVSLKDAHDSGAHRWPSEDKENFANDRANHVSACAKVNSSKGSSTPSDFLRKAVDRKGLDYEITSVCNYLEIYHSVKRKYKLSFSTNSVPLFNRCSLDIP